MVKKVVFAAVAVGLLAVLGIHPAEADEGVLVKPVTFVGSGPDQCGSAPAGTKKGVSAKWQNKAGLPDSGKSDYALILTKSDPTELCSAAGAALTGVAGMPADTLGFDYRADSHCSGGAARFNVVATDGFHFMGGCGNGSPTPAGLDARGDAWNTVVFDLQNPSQAFPPVSEGATLISVSLIQDEQGTSVLDNVTVNGTPAGRPGSA